jgi:hypothetical protein
MQINILVVVNVSKALQEGTLQDNLWLVDTNPNNMSQNEANAELETACAVGDHIVWSVTSIDPDLPVSIYGFDGNAVSSNPQVIAPYAIDPDKTQWRAAVNVATHADPKQQGQYNMTLVLGTESMSFDPYIDSVPRS